MIEPRPGYWLGLLYLGLIASALAFWLYFEIIRKIGPAKAAYSSVLIPVIAMAISTVLRRLSLVGARDRRRRCSPSPACSSRCAPAGRAPPLPPTE